jgi:hypothetical protein
MDDLSFVVMPPEKFNYLTNASGRSGYSYVDDAVYDYHPIVREFLQLPAKIPGWYRKLPPEPTVMDTASVFALAIGLAHQDEARRRGR